jgi:hypothetical protein
MNMHISRVPHMILASKTLYEAALWRYESKRLRARQGIGENFTKEDLEEYEFEMFAYHKDMPERNTKRSRKRWFLSSIAIKAYEFRKRHLGFWLVLMWMAHDGYHCKKNGWCTHPLYREVNTKPAPLASTRVSDMSYEDHEKNLMDKWGWETRSMKSPLEWLSPVFLDQQHPVDLTMFTSRYFLRPFQKGHVFHLETKINACPSGWVWWIQGLFDEASKVPTKRHQNDKGHYHDVTRQLLGHI